MPNLFDAHLTRTEGLAMELYYFLGATCGLKVRLLVAEKRIPLGEIVLDRCQLNEAKYLTLNPRGVVPTLVDNSRVIVESTTIMRYLDDASEKVAFSPREPIERARMNNWLKLMDEAVFPSIGYLTLAVAAAPSLKHLSDCDLLLSMSRAAMNRSVARTRCDAVRSGLRSQALHDAVETLEAFFAFMDSTLAGSYWLAGPHLSLADFAMAPLFTRLDELGFLAWLLPHTFVSQWWSRLSSRESYCRVVSDRPNPDASRYLDHEAVAWPRIAELRSEVDRSAAHAS